MTSPEQRRQNLSALLNAPGITLAKPPILIPASDYFDLAGEEFGRRLLLTNGVDGKQYCLRPDFTLPIANSHIAADTNMPATYSYLGPVFRQRETGPTEFEQAGLELLDHNDPDQALREVFQFTKNTLTLYETNQPHVRLGSVALFEALLDAADMPDVWRPRLRRRFGSPKAMAALLDRLSAPDVEIDSTNEASRATLIANITERMLESGYSLMESRRPEEIVDRFLEKQALAAARIPQKTLDLLRNYLAIAGDWADVLLGLQNLFKSSDIALTFQLEAIDSALADFVKLLPEASFRFETGFSPRLHYYTGLVFEMTGSAGDILVSGGQYDRLLQSLGATRPVPACGCAIWVDRLERQATNG